MHYKDASETGSEDAVPSRSNQGRTDFGGHGELAKHDIRVTAYGDCAEANETLGLAVALGQLPLDTNELLNSVQNDLLDLTADLKEPLDSEQEAEARITVEHLQRLDRAVADLSEDVPDLEANMLPGGTAAAALLYQARTVVGRAERTVWKAVEEFPNAINPLAGEFLDYLSTLLLILARLANAEHGHIHWEPGASAIAMDPENDDDHASDRSSANQDS